MSSRRPHQQARRFDVDQLIPVLVREGMRSRTDQIVTVIAASRRTLTPGEQDELTGKLAHVAGIFASLCDPASVDVDRILTQLSHPRLAVALHQASAPNGSL